VQSLSLDEERKIVAYYAGDKDLKDLSEAEQKELAIGLALSLSAGTTGRSAETLAQDAETIRKYIFEGPGAAGD
jgi:hypothetical protein